MRPEAPVPSRDTDLGVKTGYVFIQNFPFRRDGFPGVRTPSLQTEKPVHANETSQPVVEVTVKGKHAIDRNFHAKITFGEHR